MKLISIELNNIGLYKNDKIEFPYIGKNTIYIWGNNGAGKTTLLNSIKLVLFGKEAFKLDDSNYIKFINESVISSRLETEKKKAKIICEIEINENYEKHICRVIREWNTSQDSFEEISSVFVDERKLSFDEKEDFFRKISIQIPSSLLDVIIFDGENAIDILKNDQMPKLIKNIIFSTFGMDVYLNLSKDLSLYLKNSSRNDNSDSNSHFELIKYETDYKEAYAKYNFCLMQLNEITKRERLQINQLNNLTNKLSEKTGIDYSKFDELKNDIVNLENEKKQRAREFKYIQEEILPLKIVHKKILGIIEQINIEKPYLVLKNIDKLKSFFVNDKESLELLNQLEKKINIQENNFNIKYNLSEKNSSDVIKIESVIAKYPKQKLIDIYKEKHNSSDLLQEKLEKLNLIDSDEVKDIIENIKSMTDDILSTKLLLLETQKNLDILTEDMESKKCIYNDYKKELLDNKKMSNSYINIFSYKETIDKFILLTITDICQKMNDELLKNLKSIKFRNDSIKKVIISPKTFEIKLYEKNNKLILSKLFSAGEKQILLGLIIKSALQIAKFNSFFLFDTPVGRLDSNNRYIFTKDVIFTVADQVIVFATDSDYSAEDYKAVRSYINSEIKLLRNSNDEIVLEKGSIY